MMQEFTNRSNGWTGSEAFERCRDSDLWEEEERTQRRMLDAKGKFAEGMEAIGPRPIWFASEVREFEERKSAYKAREGVVRYPAKEAERAYAEARAAVDAHFLDMLHKCRLITYGRDGKPTSEPVHFPEFMWGKNFKRPYWRSHYDQDQCCYRSGKAIHQVYELRYFPILKTTNVLHSLHGLSLVEVFARHVIGDPEFHSACAALHWLNDKNVYELEKGYFPGEGAPVWNVALRAMPGLWQWHHESEAFEDRKGSVRSSGESSEELGRATAVFNDRLGTLFSMLRSGALCAYGKPEGARRERIPAAEWSRDDTVIDFRNGDLWRCLDDEKTLVYSSIILDRPRGDADGEAAVNSEAVSYPVASSTSKVKLEARIDLKVRQLDDPIAYFSVRNRKAEWSRNYAMEFRTKEATVYRYLSRVLATLQQESERE